MPELGKQFRQLALDFHNPAAQEELFEPRRYETGPQEVSDPDIPQSGRPFKAVEIDYEVGWDPDWDEEDPNSVKPPYDPKKHELTVRAYSRPTGKRVGRLSFYPQGSHELGEGAEISMADVSPLMQGSGIGTNMLNEARNAFPHVSFEHSASISSQGAKWRDTDPHLRGYESNMSPNVIHHRKHLSYQPELGEHVVRDINPAKNQGSSDDWNWYEKVGFFREEGRFPDPDEVLSDDDLDFGTDY